MSRERLSTRAGLLREVADAWRAHASRWRRGDRRRRSREPTPSALFQATAFLRRAARRGAATLAALISWPSAGRGAARIRAARRGAAASAELALGDAARKRDVDVS